MHLVPARDFEVYMDLDITLKRQRIRTRGGMHADGLALPVTGLACPPGRDLARDLA
jgi:hypothetical protein